MAKAKTAKKAKKVAVDWSDEDSVKAAMASALDCDVADLTIEEDRSMSSFRAGNIYRVELGTKEYYVAENDGIAHELAVAVVKQDLEQEPEIFERNFIESHINIDQLRRDLHSDVYDSEYESTADEAKRRPIEFFKDRGIDIPKPTQKQLRAYADAMSDDDTSAESILEKLAKGDAEDKWIEMGEEPEVSDKILEEVVEDYVKDRLSDPISYLADMYSHEEAVKKAIEIAGIDIDAAAEEAVSTDGEGHFLSGYDGNIHEGPGGIVYWRHN